MTAMNVDTRAVRLDGDPTPFTAELSATTAPDDPVTILRLRLAAASPARPGPLTLRWRAPLRRTHLV